MAYRGIRLSDEEQKKYKDAKEARAPIAYNGFIMKKFAFRGPEQEIIRLLSYVESTYGQKIIMNKINDEQFETFTCINDEKLLRDFPMLKATGFVLETSNTSETIIYAGAVFKDSGYSYPTEYKRMIDYYVDIDESTHVFASKAFCWPRDKNPAKSFRTRYKDYYPDGKSAKKSTSLEYEFSHEMEWNDGRYIFLKDGEYYLYDNSSNYFIENRVLKGYEGGQKELGVPSYVDVIGEKAFKGNKDVIKITLPNLKEICDEAFSECSNLKYIKLKKTLTKIGKDAFAYCDKLIELEIPDNVKFIGEGAFFKCGVGRVVWPKGVTVISTGMFRECNNLYEIVIPPEVKEIGRRVFCRSNTVIIYGKTGSYAEQYAKDNGMYFKAIEFDEC